jgi:hypothetical protein
VLASAILGISAGAFITTAHAAGTTRYVSPGAIAGLNTDCALPGYNTIQSAVNASAAGDTIIVCPGTYNEQVTVTQSLTLAGSGNAIIQPTTISSVSPDHDVVDISGASTSVTMSGFTVAGPGTAGCNSIHTGIAVFGGANLNLSSTTVRDITDTPFGGCQNGEGIRIGTARYSTTPDVGTATIDNVSVYDYQKNGIVVAGTVGGVNSTAKITNTTVTGQGPTPVIANNGIEVVDGASAVISTTTIRNNVYTGSASAVACGLLIISANGVNNDGTNVYLDNQKNVCVSHGKGGTFQG